VKWLLWCLAVLLLPRAGHASTLELYGFGPRATALAGTSEAVADDFYAVYANPANLTLGPRLHVGFGTDVVWNRFQIDRVAGTDAYPSRLPTDNVLGHIGVSSPLPGFLRDKVGVGVAAHLPLVGSTRLDGHDYRAPQLPIYDTLGDRLAVVFGVGARPWRWLALGVSAQLLTTLQGSADIDVSILDHRITRKQLDVQLLTELFPIVGATWLPREDLRLALVWRAESQVRYGLPLDVHIEDFGRLRFTIRGVGLYLPETYALAGSWRRGSWLLTAGAALARWSGLPPLAPDVRLVLDDSDLQRQGGKPNEILYVQHEPIAMGARDIVQPRLGLEWQPRPALVWRGGVQYRPTPLPRADGPAAYLDAPALTWGLGAGLQLAGAGEVRRPLQIDLALAGTVLARRTVTKLDPNDPVAATSVHGYNLHLALALHHDF